MAEWLHGPLVQRNKEKQREVVRVTTVREHCGSMTRTVSFSIIDISVHTLCLALNVLAVHQEEQETLYRHIQDVLPDGRLPVRVQNCHHLRSQDEPGL